MNGFVSTMCSRWFNLPQFLKGNANKYINEQSYKGGREVLWVHRDLLEGGDVRDGGIKEGSETKGRVEEKNSDCIRLIHLGYLLRQTRDNTI